MAVLVSAGLLLAGAADTAAQSVDEGGVRLTLSKIPDIEHGTAAILQGEAGSDGDKFFIEHLNITQPVSVVLMAANPGQQPLTLNLSKYRFDQSDRRGGTGDSGAVAFHFRTQGEVKIHVTPESGATGAPAPYFLVAWAGEGLQPEDLSVPVVPASMAGDDGPSWLWLLATVGGGVLLVIAALTWRRLRGGASRAAAFVLVAAGMSLLPITLLAGARPLGSLGALRAAPEAMARDAENAANRRAINESGRNAVDTGIGHLETGMGLYESSRGFTEADAALRDVLNPDDNAFDPNFDPDGAPQLPAHCAAEGGEDCACYERAYRKLNFVRFYLERLRAIYGATKNYTDNAIAFGDSMAGLHGGFGIAWPPERRGIQQAFEKLGGTYDEKYEGYMRELREALDAIGTCEAEHHGVEDWYNRFGFMYFSFMQDRYRR